MKFCYTFFSGFFQVSLNHYRKNVQYVFDSLLIGSEKNQWEFVYIWIQMELIQAEYSRLVWMCQLPQYQTQ